MLCHLRFGCCGKSFCAHCSRVVHELHALEDMSSFCQLLKEQVPVLLHSYERPSKAYDTFARAHPLWRPWPTENGDLVYELARGGTQDADRQWILVFKGGLEYERGELREALLAGNEGVGRAVFRMCDAGCGVGEVHGSEELVHVGLKTELLHDTALEGVFALFDRLAAFDRRDVRPEYDLAHGLAADMEAAALVTQDPAPAADPAHLFEASVRLLREADDDTARASNACDGTGHVGVHLQWSGKEVGVVANNEVLARGHTEQRGHDGGDRVDRALTVDAGDAEPCRGEEWCGGWKRDGLDGRRGYASFESVADGDLDCRYECVNAKVGKVGWAAECTTLDLACGIADDGGRFGATAVDTKEERHGLEGV